MLLLGVVAVVVVKSAGGVVRPVACGPVVLLQRKSHRGLWLSHGVSCRVRLSYGARYHVEVPNARAKPQRPTLAHVLHSTE